MTNTLFALILASTFMVPHIAAAIWNESATECLLQRWDSIGLPAIPHLDTMPWLTRGSLTAGPKIDMLWPPTPVPSLLELNISETKFSASRPATHRTK
jgi:hypothetical protein